MNEEEFAELAAGAALGALSPDDEQRFRAALFTNPEWRSIAETEAETAALLTDAVASVTPPDNIRASLLAQIATTPQGVEPDDRPGPTVDAPGVAHATDASRARDEPRSAPRRWTRVVFALAACLALLVGVGIGAVALNDQLNRPASVVALEEIQAAGDAAQATVELDGGGSATAHWSASLGTAVLVADDIEAPEDGKTYELWFLRGDAPIAAGVFDVDDGDATAVLDGDMHEGDAIAVTVEQAGGSPNGQPTSDPVLVIPTA
ncbi:MULTISPECIES: anti-sigma factor domain-containing protein [unclassified Microbacterium]|uniref:anti-sigma factor n=1 Tax=unclassified Microbacterium TaxID=2609290 RepID=UPI000EA982A1|nr:MULTISPECIES: anti-sigma factor [unclassified Microbacterium]MBT2483206.1 anti-sigma factor [Microbacterium sp. ISL-108]RKN66258.1 anti-sigma factor [Microbacterium sp. CGR2]